MLEWFAVHREPVVRNRPAIQRQLFSERNMQDPAEIEIVFNLWYLTDESTGLVYSLLGRAYAMAGSDEEKLDRLRDLAWTEWMLSKRYRVPERFEVVNALDGTKQSRLIDPRMLSISEHLPEVFEEVFQELEKEFPPKFVMKGDQFVAMPQVASPSPLMVCSFLVEDEIGNVSARGGSQRKMQGDY
jgi:hypothetical protein